MRISPGAFRPVLLAAGLALAAGPSLAQSSDPARPRVVGLDPADMDTSCRACGDFYRFANGGWLDRNPVPAARSSWSSYAEVDEKTRADVRAVLADAVRVSRTSGTNSPTEKLGRLYTLCLDSARAEREGAAPLADGLRRIDAVRERAHLQMAMTHLHRVGLDVPWGIYAIADPRQSRHTAAEIWQSGISLPDRDDYLNDDSTSRALRERFVAHVARMLELAGTAPAEARTQAAAVLSMETELARASMSRVEERDPKATDNRLTRAELDALTPHWDWGRYFVLLSIAPLTREVVVGQPRYMAAVDRMLAERPLDEWRAYLRWRVVLRASPYLSAAFGDERFRFNQALTGARAQRPREERCMGLMDALMGETLGKMYVERAFTPESRRRGLEIIANLRAVMRERLAGLEWMGPETRERAIAKLDSMAAYVGGPDRPQTYDGVEVSEGPMLENVELAIAAQRQQRLAEIGQPRDRTRWFQLAHVSSGAYSPSENRLVYPAAKFQAPFFDPAADDAVNYGALGATIGHEIVHGFDDQGRQYDAAGNLRDWWTAEDDRRFRERADRLVAQYDARTVADTVRVNGRLSLGENIADLGGVTLAYHALQRSLRGKPRETVGGFTPEQRFFLSFARNWRWSWRPEALRLQVKTGPHAPGHLRGTIPLTNMPEFAAAFGCKPGDPMVRPESERVRIW
ncbi:MAG TPA: M13 family metallopeptidase [Longimicrobium sp.]|nr:M13 family metallopeptidase [Longimicrobium sp.]